jgi:hypothetical protein
MSRGHVRPIALVGAVNGHRNDVSQRITLPRPVLPAIWAIARRPERIGNVAAGRSSDQDSPHLSFRSG